MIFVYMEKKVLEAEADSWSSREKIVPAAGFDNQCW